MTTESATLTITWSSGGKTRTGTITKSAGGLTRRTETIPGGSTNLLLALTADVSAIESYWFKSDRAMTIKTNDADTPDNTLSLVAGEPQAWAKNNGPACPLTVDITALYVTLAAGDASVLEIEILEDPTP